MDEAGMLSEPPVVQAMEMAFGKAQNGDRTYK
jgi:hypothetical protein